MRQTFDAFPKLAVASPRFSVYIDGYNLYYAIDHPIPEHLLGLGWCNCQRLGELLVEKSFVPQSARQHVTVKYFTSSASGAPLSHGEVERQQLWLDALKDEAPNLTIKWGQHRPRPQAKGRREEKMTDVKIALEVAHDIASVEARPAAAPGGIVLVSDDLDFQPVVEHAAGAGVPIVVFTPGDRQPYNLEPGKDSSLVRFSYLTEDLLRKCRLRSDFLPYLRLKVASQPEFAGCLAFEERRGK